MLKVLSWHLPERIEEKTIEKIIEMAIALAGSQAGYITKSGSSLF
jgi:hypothetical protein